MELSTHSGRLDRWLGTATAERISASMKDWYGPPIAVGNVPGAVYACAGGDFRGRIRAGQVAPLVDYYEQRLKRIVRRASRAQLHSLHAGFGSLEDLISEAKGGGKLRRFIWQKPAVVTSVSGTVSYWRNAGVPAAAAASAAAPGGEALTSALAGAHPFVNPTGGDTQHFVGGRIAATVANVTFLLYDRIFQVAKTMNSNAAEAVTGAPTRYQSSTRGDPDCAAGNFAFPETQTNMASGAHNWTVCRYRDQDGNDAVSFPSFAGISANTASRIDLATPNWFMPLADNDDGVKDLDQMQYDTSLIATGAVSWVIGHPIAFMPVAAASVMVKEDGLLTAFNLTRIFDDAALAFISLHHAAGTNLDFTAYVDTVAG